MQRYVRIKKTDIFPQAGGIFINQEFFCPILWHTAINQDMPIGRKSTFSEHIHDFFHIVLYTKGKGYYLKEEKFEQAIPGTCVLIHPGQKHDFVSKMENAVYSEITFSYVSQNKQNCRASFDQIISAISGISCHLLESIILSEEARNTLYTYFIQITDYLNSSRPRSLYYAHWTLGNIFNFIIENCTLHKPSKIIDDRLIQLQMWIEKHYVESISMDELAQMAGFSKGYFFRAFKNTFGMPPLAYQQKLRIEAAKTLLKTTSLRCNEIAYRVGFNDVYFFHRIFKKHVNLTPNQYRKQRY